MGTFVERAIKRSNALFTEHVWPVVGPAIGGGELVPVETVTESGFARDLDTLAGVDAWQVTRPEGMRPIASRVQQSQAMLDGSEQTYRPWNTFTIRYSRPTGAITEFHKRIASIRDGYLYPHLTVQAYFDTFDSARLLTVAIVDTLTLYRLASGWHEVYGTEDELWRRRDGCYVKDVSGGTKMLVVDWDRVQSSAPDFFWRYDADRERAA